MFELTGLIVLLAVLLVLLIRRPQKVRARASTHRPAPTKVVASEEPTPSVALPPKDEVPEPVAIVPASLRDFAWQAAESLPQARREQLLTELAKTPPPPRAFHQLVSPDFVARASSADLAELVIGVPMAATKVLARVNSAFYGLQQPVSSVGKAITYLGLNSVRTICLQYMMEASFNNHTRALKHRFDQLWAASAIASELSQKLAQRLRLPDPSSLVTNVALSSLGHFSAATLMPRAAASASTQSLLTRAWSEQDQLGAPAAEIGALLMRAWDLPEALVEEVRSIDRVLVTPVDLLEPSRAMRLAVGYLSARLGERLARGESVNLSDFQQSVLQGDDYFHVRAGLSAVQQRQLSEALQAPDIARVVQTMLAAMAEPGPNA